MDPIMLGTCPECGHFPTQLVGDENKLDYVIHLSDQANCPAGPHHRIHELEAEVERLTTQIRNLLPERLSRNQAQPLCELTCTDVCEGDCDCNSDVQEAWQLLRAQLINKEE